LDEEMKEYRKKKQLEEDEINKYGRQWIWEKYISDNRKEVWLETAETLRHINKHVVSDIQDFIMIQGFKKEHQKKRQLIDEKVETLLLSHEDPKINEDKNLQQEILRKRKFEMEHRPPYVWNFFETRADREEKVKIQRKQDIVPEGEKQDEDEDKENKRYLLNAFSDPMSCYRNEEAIKENRVSKVLQSIETLSYNLRTHETEKWKTLTNLCIAIFKHMIKIEAEKSPTKK
jgi:hypothetical protein